MYSQDVIFGNITQDEITWPVQRAHQDQVGQQRYTYTLVNTFTAYLNHAVCAKTLDHTWLCASVTLAPKAVESCTKAQSTRQVL